MKSFNPNPVRKVDYPSKAEKPKNVSNEENKKDKEIKIKY